MQVSQATQAGFYQKVDRNQDGVTVQEIRDLGTDGNGALDENEAAEAGIAKEDLPAMQAKFREVQDSQLDPQQVAFGLVRTVSSNDGNGQVVGGQYLERTLQRVPPDKLFARLESADRFDTHSFAQTQLDRGAWLREPLANGYAVYKDKDTGKPQVMESPDGQFATFSGVDIPHASSGPTEPPPVVQFDFVGLKASGEVEAEIGDHTYGGSVDYDSSTGEMSAGLDVDVFGGGVAVDEEGTAEINGSIGPVGASISSDGSGSIDLGPVSVEGGREGVGNVSVESGYLVDGFNYDPDTGEFSIQNPDKLSFMGVLELDHQTGEFTASVPVPGTGYSVVVEGRVDLEQTQQISHDFIVESVLPEIYSQAIQELENQFPGG